MLILFAAVAPDVSAHRVDLEAADLVASRAARTQRDLPAEHAAVESGLVLAQDREAGSDRSDGAIPFHEDDLVRCPLDARHEAEP